MDTGEKIYRDYHSKVCGYIRSKVNSVQEAEDIAADVFLKVFEKLDSFDESKASLSTWIYTITRNTLTDYFRTRKVFAEIPETLEDGSSVEDDVCNAEMLENLANALETLDERERDIIILRFYSGKTLREISSQMGISYAYVKVLQNKAFEKLRKFYDAVAIFKFRSYKECKTKAEALTMDNKLRKLFDYQRFEGNERLAKFISETESRYAKNLSDDDLSFVNAAGEPVTSGAINIENSTIEPDSSYGAGK